MNPRDIALALLVAVVWGLAFVAIRLGLNGFSPPQLMALRFVIAALPALVVARPKISWAMLLALGMALFTGQFLFGFFAMANGMPPGLASVVVQTQALFTVLFAAVLFGERPAPRQLGGLLTAVVGLTLIGLTVGRGLTAIGLALSLASAVSWSIGNVLLKRLPKIPKVDMLPLMVWLSLVPPLPGLALSSVLDGVWALPVAFTHASWSSLGAVLYLGVVATVGAYAVWGHLLHKYPAASVTPFAMLVPCVAALSSAIVFGERFESLRLAGMATMLVGVGVAILPFGPGRGIRERRSATPIVD